MILSLTPNTTLDQAMLIPAFRPGATIRASQTLHTMGGKPTDVSWILGKYGVPSTALGMAAGAIGSKIRSLLEARGVTVDFVEALGESRMALLIVTEDDGEQTTITPNTLQIEPQHVTLLLDKVAAALPQANVLVTGGTLPTGMTPDFYTTVIEMANRQGVPVVFDAKEPNLTAGLKARPAYIKPNRDEISMLHGSRVTTLTDAYAVGRRVYDDYGTQSVITLGADGALAVLADRAYRIPPLNVPIVSAAGAGDAVLAGITWAVHLNKPIEEGLRLGIATASAVCMQLGTAEFDLADADRLLEEVTLIPFI